MACEDDGHEVVFCRTGEKALEIVALSPPDLILLDVMMPGMSGLDVARGVRAMPGAHDIPIVFMSAFSRMADAARQIGTPYMLAKPFDIDDLSEMLRRCLTGKPLDRSDALG